jgi:hypothetical protein
VDATRIAQIFLNLLTNAAKFTPAGGRIWLTVNQGSDRVTVVVRDSGIGIAPEDQDRVFGMFVQLNRDLRRSQTGLGIGLTLVKQMANCTGQRGVGARPGPRQRVHGDAAARRSPGRAGARRPAARRRGASWSPTTAGRRRQPGVPAAAAGPSHTAYDGHTAIHWRKRAARRRLLDIGMPSVRLRRGAGDSSRGLGRAMADRFGWARPSIAARSRG